MLLRSDKPPGFVQFIDESRTNWYFTVVSKDGEIGLITAHDLMTGEIIELGSRMKKCIFVRPEEYLELIGELEALRDFAGDDKDSTFCYSREYSKGTKSRGEQEVGDRAWREALDAAIQLVAQRANPQPGIE